MSSHYQLNIANLSCGGCVGRAERAVASIPGVEVFSVNLASKSAQLTIQDAQAFPQVVRALERAGYPAIDPPADPVRAEREAHDALARQWQWAAWLSAPLLLIEMSAHLFHWYWIPQPWQPAWHFAQWCLATAVLAGPARGLLASGAKSLIRLAPDMNALVLLGAGSAYVFSIWVWLSGASQGLYFEAAAVISTLILLGRWLEQGAKGRAGEAIQSLLELAPSKAWVWREGAWGSVDNQSVIVGDRLRVLPGEAIPADGDLLVSGWIDESLMTGESRPMWREVGQAVVGGSLNSGDSTLELIATATGQATALAQIVDMVAQAQATRLPVQALINRITLYFVPGVLLLAAGTFSYWSWVSDVEQAWIYAVSVLIIACPCAMGLATPISIVVGMGRAASLGALFRQGESLERLPQVKTIAFDKTGTLTQGQPELIRAQALEGFEPEQIRHWAASLEAHSNHPLARALQAETMETLESFTQHPGQGMHGLDSEGRVLALGKISWLETLAGPAPQSIPLDCPDTLVGLVCQGQWAGWFEIADPLKEGAAEACQQLRDRGFRLVMLSGDRAAVADHIGKRLGFHEVYAQLSPEEKLSWLAEHTEAAFVGDGINDAPALTQATVGLAIGSGTQVAIESADIVLMKSDPLGVVDAIRVAKATLRNIRQNLMWAFGYNLVLIPVAMGAWGFSLSPMLAAGAMALSSVFVVGNSLRLRWQ